ncbi:hypothetical protein Tco_0922152 [Tanacetum coccineum]|uniref:Uncharacterized protein n=1 Tax=Tanacetum coccineum TaxID=301880 RepID=A0ABQ5CYB8_9ASTR
MQGMGVIRVQIDMGNKEVTKQDLVAKVVMEVLGRLLGDMVSEITSSTTMEEYAQFETEKALRNGKTYNWETANHAKVIWCLEKLDVDTCRFFETNFPTIVYNDALKLKMDLPFELKSDINLECKESSPEQRRYGVSAPGLHKKTRKMDDPNIIIEEYIRLEKEKARRNGKVYNWETATYGKIWYDEDVHDLRSVETKFPAIVFNDELTSEEAFSCGPTVIPLNDNEIDFKISFDESNDEDYTVIYEENSFSYKIIYVNNLKTGSENDNDKVNMPSFPSPEPEDLAVNKSKI